MQALGDVQDAEDAEARGDLRQEDVDRARKSVDKATQQEQVVKARLGQLPGR